ncbi:hypothetical protein QN391_21600 [Pseudomonas sp. CCI1.2]|uniref:hypothetical protein n=1 Tax=unclassified Pseudomonas TaxID=196821 RepID=UPI002B22C44C|nr:MULTISPECIES: hypothetical protein [unclassified Pseudomonas]MEB0092344.1 hypothetical protein [Pseudomonas sp. CCI4.2]MEB0123256.1 hypothetical protein [Pseudomonas sp. CCI1.2]
MIPNFGFIALGAATACVNLCAPFFLGATIDHYQEHHELHIWHISAACISFILSPCIKLYTKIQLAKSNAATRLKLKQKSVQILIQHNRGSLPEGDIIEFVDNDVDGSIYLYHNIYFDISVSLAAICLSLIAIYNYHFSLLIAPIAAIIFSSLVYITSRTVIEKTYGRYVEQNTVLISNIISASQMKSGPSFDVFDELKKDTLMILCKTQLKISTLEAATGFSFLIGMSLLLYIGDQLLQSNAITLGALIASAMYIERILNPLGFLLGIYFSSAEAIYRRSRMVSLHGKTTFH